MGSVVPRLDPEQLAALGWLRSVHPGASRLSRAGNVAYGAVFETAFLELAEAWPARGGPLLIEDVAGRVLRGVIDRAPAAEQPVGEAMSGLLGIYEGARIAFQSGSTLPDNALVKPVRRDDVETAWGALGEPIGDDVFEQFRAATYVAVGLVWDRWDCYYAVATHDPSAARLGAGAYLEAAALMTRLQAEIRPPGLVPGYWLYYVGRRTADPIMLRHGRAWLVYGSGDSAAPNGCLSQMAGREYRWLPDADREIAIDDYCDGFMRALDGLPVDALLCPALAIGYALRSAERSGNEILSRARVFPLGPDELLPSPTAFVSIEESEEIGEEDERFAWLKNLPHFETWRRHLECVPVPELAAGEGVSRTAIYKRLAQFREAAERFRATGVVRGKPDRLGEAMHALREILKDGPKPADDVKAEAATMGVSERTLRRAKKELPIDARKTSFRGPWLWDLPAGGETRPGALTPD